MPLVLRFYPSIEAADKGALEYRTISHLASAGYPVPRPYLFEPGGAAIGAPFLVMERLSGGPLFAIRSFPQAFKTFSMGFLGFVRAQTRLHRMALAPFALEALRMPAAANQPELARAQPKIMRKTVRKIVATGWRGRAPARTHPPDRRGARRAGSATGIGRGVGAFAPSRGGVQRRPALVSSPGLPSAKRHGRRAPRHGGYRLGQRGNR